MLALYLLATAVLAFSLGLRIGVEIEDRRHKAQKHDEEELEELGRTVNQHCDEYYQDGKPIESCLVN